MKLKIAATLLVLAAALLLWAPATPAATPGVEAPDADLSEKAALEAAQSTAPLTPLACTPSPFATDPTAGAVWGFGDCNPSSCNKSCLIQGYDYGRCQATGCFCYYYV